MESDHPLIPLKWLVGNDPAHLTATQQMIEPYVYELVLFWKVVWVVTAIVLLFLLLNEYRQSRQKTDMLDEAC